MTSVPSDAGATVARDGPTDAADASATSNGVGEPSADNFAVSDGAYRELFQQHPQPMYVCDAVTLQFLLVNDATVQRYGYSREEFLRMTLSDIRPAADEPRLQDDIATMQFGVRNSGIRRHRLRDGRDIAVEISAHRLMFGGRDALVVLAIDITEKVASENALRVSLAEKAVLAEDLRAERERLIAAQSVANVGSWELSLPGYAAKLSDEMYRIYGLSADAVELTYQSALARVHPDDLARSSAVLAESLEHPEQLASHEHRIVLPDGSIRVVEHRWRVSVDAHGVRQAVIGTTRDVTAQRRMVSTLQASEERFRLVAEAAHVAVWDWNLVTGDVWWNEAFEAIFGRRESTYAAHHDWWTRGLHPDERDAVDASLDKAIRGDAAEWICEYHFLRHDGDYAFVRDHAHVIRDGRGRATRMIGGTTDLTARYSAEARLREQAAMLDAAHDAIVLRDMSDRVRYWNRGAERLFGWTAAEAIGRVTSELIGAEPGEQDRARAALLANGTWEGELTKRTREGRERQVEVRWSLVRGDDDTPQAVLAIMMDVTERKQLEAKFLRAQRLESIGTLAGGIAHDLNNMLAPILLSIELLRLGETNDERLDTLLTIEASARRGADMVQQVLNFARGMEGERRDTDLGAIAQAVVKIARETFPKDIVVRCRIPADLRVVTADATQIHQVLMNLVVNARDAMPNGGTLDIVLANAVVDETYAGMHVASRPGCYVTFSVIDSGIGIPPDVQEKLFEPFFTTKDQGKGTGLGLSTVHTIVRSHGGFVDLYSEQGHGARFTVHLPAADVSRVATSAAASSVAIPRGHGEVVLVVDDEATIRAIVQKSLEAFGYRVLLASNGAEAVATYVQHGAVDVVLTDMAMPIMDGSALIMALRALDPRAKILASSGMMSTESLARASVSGIAQFVPKPYTADTLLLAVHRVLRQ